MGRSFPKEARLRAHSDFRPFVNPQARLVGKAIIVELNKQELNLTRLGITVSKKYGKSNLRNRFKRIVREAFRLSQALLPQGLDLNVKPRTDAYQATSKEIEAELIDLLNSPYVNTLSTRSIRPKPGTTIRRKNGKRPSADPSRSR